MSTKKQVPLLQDGVLHSELLLGLSGALPEHKEFQALFELVSDALDDDDSTKKAIAFSTMMIIAEQRFDLLDGSIQEGSWGNTEDGWKLLCRNEDGYSAWYHEGIDELLLQHNFFK